MSATNRGKHGGVEAGGQDDLPSLIAAAHELKSPLALIRQLAISIESKSGGQELADLAQKIVLTSERALNLTTGLTRSTRLDDALFKLEPINPVNLCFEVAAQMEPLVRAHGLRFNVLHRRHAPLVVANRELLAGILTTFSDNAINYSQSTRPIEISLQNMRKRQLVRIGVRDFGPALDNKAWKKLAARLASGPQALRARPQSSGLGIYIASRFAQAMGGKIGAIRHRDGATFYVELDTSCQLSLL